MERPFPSFHKTLVNTVPTLTAVVGLIAALSGALADLAVIVQGDHNRANQRAPLPPARDRTTVPAVFDTGPAFYTYMPGGIAPATGVYFPVGQLVSRDHDLRVSPVTRGQAVAHEVYLEAGEPLPELTGYEAGAMWLLEPPR